MKKQSYKLATGIIVVTIMLVSLLLVGIHVVELTKRDVNNQNVQYLTEMAKQNTKSIEKTVEQELDTLKSISNIVGNRDTFDKDEIIDILKLEAERTCFKRLSYIDINGYAMTTDEHDFMASDREYVTLARQGMSGVTGRLNDKTDELPINVFYTPLIWNGEFKGTIIATSTPDFLSDVLSTDTLDGAGYSYIIDGEGNLIAHTELADAFHTTINMYELLHPENSEQELEEIRNILSENQQGTFEYTFNNKKIMATFTMSTINDWNVISVIPQTFAMDYANRLISRSILSVLIFIIVICLLAAAIILINYKNTEKLEKLAYIDPMLGCNNLNRFKILAKKKMDTYDGGMYMARIDIDNFKIVNDIYSYKEGDYLLFKMKDLIAEILTNDGLFCHDDADNFVALLTVDSEKAVLEIGAEFRAKFSKELIDDGKNYKVNFTTGVYRINQEDDDIDLVIDKTIIAHKYAKKLPAERKYCFYNEEMRKSVIHEMEVENVMYEALKNGEFQPFFQTKTNINTGKAIGAEALIRWIKNGVIIPPSEFLPLFERNGFIVNIDLFVLEEVCKIQRELLDKGITPIPISVNQSKALVYNKGYIQQVENVIKKYDLPLNLIELELLESIIHENIDDFTEICVELRKKGFLICIDDFGSGYSSFNLLKTIEADVLKVDREFLTSAEDSQRAEYVLGSVISLAHGLNMLAIVEGVETEKQVKLLGRLHCKLAQGFYYSVPTPKAEYEEYLKNNP